MAKDQPIGTVWVFAHMMIGSLTKKTGIIKTSANFAAAGWQLWKGPRTAEAVAAPTNPSSLAYDIVVFRFRNNGQ